MGNSNFQKSYSALFGSSHLQDLQFGFLMPKNNSAHVWGHQQYLKLKLRVWTFLISFLKSPWSMGYFTSQAASSRQLEQFSASISCVGGTLSDPYNIKFPLTFMLWLCSEKWMSCGCQLLFYTITLNINVSGNSMVNESLHFFLSLSF